MKDHLFRILKQETKHTDVNIWRIIKKYYEENGIDEDKEVVKQNALLAVVVNNERSEEAVCNNDVNKCPKYMQDNNGENGCEGCEYYYAN